MKFDAKVRKLKSKGWYFVSGMLIKEQVRPYCKCIAAVRNKRIKRVYWYPVVTDSHIKEKFISELKSLF